MLIEASLSTSSLSVAITSLSALLATRSATKAMCFSSRCSRVDRPAMRLISSAMSGYVLWMSGGATPTSLATALMLIFRPRFCSLRMAYRRSSLVFGPFRRLDALDGVLSQSLFLMNLESCRPLNLWSQFFNFARKTQLCDRTFETTYFVKIDVSGEVTGMRFSGHILPGRKLGAGCGSMCFNIMIVNYRVDPIFPAQPERRFDARTTRNDY